MAADTAVTLQTPARRPRDLYPLRDDGGFLFEDVELLGAGPTSFTVSAVDGAGNRIASKDFTVEYQSMAEGGGQVPDIRPSLPKPLFLRTTAGLQPIADEGEPLPAEFSGVFVKNTVGPNLPIKIYQEDEDTVVGMILVKSIPEDGGPPPQVELKLTITEKNSILGTATVKTAEGQEIATCTITINFPPIKIPGLPDLIAKHEELENDRVDKEANAQSPKDRLRLGAAAKKLSARIAEALTEQPPDRQTIFQDLTELKRLVHPKSDDMDPSKQHFYSLHAQCVAMVTASEDPQVQAMAGSLEEIRSNGEKAAHAKNHREWSVQNENLARMKSRIENLVKPRKPVVGGNGDPGPKLPPTPVLKAMAMQEISGLRAQFNAKHTQHEDDDEYATVTKPKLDLVEGAIKKMEASVAAIDDGLPPEQTDGIIMTMVIQPMPSLKKAINEAHISLGAK